jgi:hypothetical protein
MSVEIHQPEIEALIQQRMASGAFHDVEEVLLYALKSAPEPAVSRQSASKRTGAELVAAMQAMPYKDTIEIEHSRPHLPVSEVTL